MRTGFRDRAGERNHQPNLGHAPRRAAAVFSALAGAAGLVAPDLPAVAHAQDGAGVSDAHETKPLDIVAPKHVYAGELIVLNLTGLFDDGKDVAFVDVFVSIDNKTRPSSWIMLQKPDDRIFIDTFSILGATSVHITVKVLAIRGGDYYVEKSGEVVVEIKAPEPTVPASQPPPQSPSGLAAVPYDRSPSLDGPPAAPAESEPRPVLPEPLPARPDYSLMFDVMGRYDRTSGDNHLGRDLSVEGFGGATGFPGVGIFNLGELKTTHIPPTGDSELDIYRTLVSGGIGYKLELGPTEEQPRRKFMLIVGAGAGMLTVNTNHYQIQGDKIVGIDDSSRELVIPALLYVDHNGVARIWFSQLFRLNRLPSYWNLGFSADHAFDRLLWYDAISLRFNRFSDREIVGIPGASKRQEVWFAHDELSASVRIPWPDGSLFRWYGIAGGGSDKFIVNGPNPFNPLGVETLINEGSGFVDPTVGGRVSVTTALGDVDIRAFYRGQLGYGNRHAASLVLGVGDGTTSAEVSATRAGSLRSFSGNVRRLP